MGKVILTADEQSKIKKVISDCVSDLDNKSKKLEQSIGRIVNSTQYDKLFNTINGIYDEYRNIVANNIKKGMDQVISEQVISVIGTYGGGDEIKKEITSMLTKVSNISNISGLFKDYVVGDKNKVRVDPGDYSAIIDEINHFLDNVKQAKSDYDSKISKEEDRNGLFKIAKLTGTSIYDPTISFWEKAVSDLETAKNNLIQELKQKDKKIVEGAKTAATLAAGAGVMAAATTFNHEPANGGLGTSGGIGTQGGVTGAKGTGNASGPGEVPGADGTESPEDFEIPGDEEQDSKLIKKLKEYRDRFASGEDAASLFGDYNYFLHTYFTQNYIDETERDIFARLMPIHESFFELLKCGYNEDSYADFDSIARGNRKELIKLRSYMNNDDADNLAISYNNPAYYSAICRTASNVALNNGSENDIDSCFWIMERVMSAYPVSSWGGENKQLLEDIGLGAGGMINEVINGGTPAAVTQIEGAPINDNPVPEDILDRVEQIARNIHDLDEFGLLELFRYLPDQGYSNQNNNNVLKFLGKICECSGNYITSMKSGYLPGNSSTFENFVDGVEKYFEDLRRNGINCNDEGEIRNFADGATTVAFTFANCVEEVYNNNSGARMSLVCLPYLIREAVENLAIREVEGDGDELINIFLNNTIGFANNLAAVLNEYGRRVVFDNIDFNKKIEDFLKKHKKELEDLSGIIESTPGISEMQRIRGAEQNPYTYSPQGNPEERDALDRYKKQIELINQKWSEFENVYKSIKFDITNTLDGVGSGLEVVDLIASIFDTSPKLKMIKNFISILKWGNTSASKAFPPKTYWILKGYSEYAVDRMRCPYIRALGKYVMVVNAFYDGNNVSTLVNICAIPFPYAWAVQWGIKHYSEEKKKKIAIAIIATDIRLDRYLDEFHTVNKVVPECKYLHELKKYLLVSGFNEDEIRKVIPEIYRAYDYTNSKHRLPKKLM